MIDSVLYFDSCIFTLNVLNFVQIFQIFHISVGVKPIKPELMHSFDSSENKIKIRYGLDTKKTNNFLISALIFGSNDLLIGNP